jgi:tetratricopeptide (TPR) repeat protein
VPALNPYTAGNPIGQAEAFFGRESVLKQVRALLRSPRESAIVLYGQRRIGKTSILLHLERELERTAAATAVYFDLQDKASKSLADVLYELAQRIGVKAGVEVPPPEAFDSAGSYFRDTFLPAATALVNKGGLVLLFDEFDVLDSAMDPRAGQTFFPYLRTWMDTAQRVRFVFVIGRRPDDLSTGTMSTFKSVRSARVSLLDPEAAKAVIRQSQRDGFEWTDDAVNEVWALTHGHAYLTQLLCSVVWETAADLSEDGSVAIDASLVRGAIDEALQQGAHAFHWIWDGLPPAERVVIAAMAEAPGPIINHEELVEILNRSGVRLIVRQLELAPETLVAWELLQREGDGYAFSVPLFRRWVSTNRPLRRVKDELDRLDPLAERLFQTGQDYYQLRDNEKAETQLRDALRINANHLKSRLLLGRMLLETDRADESVTVLEEAYAYDSRAARADLIGALLASADAKGEDQQVAIYSRVLVIDAVQPVAKTRLQQVEAAKRQRELALALKAGEEFEHTESWSAAADVYRKLLVEYPDHEDVLAFGERVERQMGLADRYAEALRMLEGGQSEIAQELLAQVIHIAPGYKEVARHLLRATTGVDVVELKASLTTAETELQRLRDEKREFAAAAAQSIDTLHQQLNDLRQQVAVQRANNEDLARKLKLLEAPERKSAPAPVTAVSVSPQQSRSADPATPRDQIVKAIALAKAGETVSCPICGKRMSREKLIEHASSHGLAVY